MQLSACLCLVHSHLRCWSGNTTGYPVSTTAGQHHWLCCVLKVTALALRRCEAMRVSLELRTAHVGNVDDMTCTPNPSTMVLSETNEEVEIR